MAQMRCLASIPIKTAEDAFKPDRQPDSDFQYLSENNTAFQLKTNDLTMQSYTVDILFSNSNDESDLSDDTAPTLVDDENIVPDSCDAFSLKDSAPCTKRTMAISFNTPDTQRTFPTCSL